MDISSLLNLENKDGYETSENNHRALLRPDIAPQAFELIVNAPVFEELIHGTLPKFLEGANPDLFETLYSACNGLSVGATKFGVFGFLTNKQGYKVPWNIEVPNWYGSPDRPKPSLIVGVSTERTAEGTDLKCYHTIQAEKEIHVTPTGDFDRVLRQYTSVESWLSAEVQRALEDRSRW